MEQAKVGRCAYDPPRLPRRNDECVGGRKQVVALIRELRRSGQDEAEDHFAPMRGKVDISASDADLGDSFGCRRDAGLCRLAAAERRPRRVRGNMAQEPLPAEVAVRVDAAGRQHDVMIGVGGVKRGQADLDHFEHRRAFEHAVADTRRLDDHVPGDHHERLALILIDHAHPPRSDHDQLERDMVIMRPVGDRPAPGDRDVRGDVASAKPPRDEVAVAHSRTPLAAFVAGTGDPEFGFEVGQLLGWRRGAGLRGQAYPLAAFAHHGAVRLVGGVDQLDPVPERLQPRDLGVEVGADPLGPAFSKVSAHASLQIRSG